MPKAGRFKYICTLQCTFSRFAYAVPTTNAGASDAVKALTELILKERVKPEVISSDRGTHFTSVVFKETLKNLKIRQKLHVSWRPQSSGNIERFHRSLKSALYMVCADRQQSWIECLPFVMSSLNSLYNTAIKTTPFNCCYGRNPNMNLPDIENYNAGASSPLSYEMRINSKLHRIHKLCIIANAEADALVELRRNQQDYKEKLEIGQEVLLFREQSAEAKRSKLNWIGPWTIKDTNGSVYLIYNADGKEQWVHRVHIRQLIKRPPELCIDDDDENLPSPQLTPTSKSNSPKTSAAEPKLSTKSKPVSKKESPSVLTPGEEDVVAVKPPVPKRKLSRNPNPESIVGVGSLFKN